MQRRRSASPTDLEELTVEHTTAAAKLGSYEERKQARGVHFRAKLQSHNVNG